VAAAFQAGMTMETFTQTADARKFERQA
jgi:hypothetical protein